MQRLQRTLPVLAAIVATWAIASASSGAAQSSIPDGVFVRNSEGLVWLVLGGERIKIPVWAASDEDIAAVPVGDRWAVMNDAHVIVAGDRPAWLGGDQAPAVAAAPPPPAANPAPATPTLTPAPAAQTNRVGDPVVLTSARGDRLVVTVHRVRDDVKSTNQFSKPQGRFVVVEWSVKNDGQDDFDFRPTSLKLLTEDNFVIDREYAAGLPEPDLDSSTIGPGQSVRGYLPYDVPKGQALKAAIFHATGSPQIMIADLGQ